MPRIDTHFWVSLRSSVSDEFLVLKIQEIRRQAGGP